MKLDQTHCPFSSPTDHKAAIYYGHLLARAEQMAGLSDRTDNLALIWLSAIAWSERTRLWSLSLKGLQNAGEDFGDWKVSVRTASAKADPVGIHRREYLAEEGRQILALAYPFTPDGKGIEPDEIVQIARRNLAEASAMRLILSHGKKSTPLEVSDLHGNFATIVLAKKNTFSRFLTKFNR